MKKTDKRKLVNWEKKSGNDSERISKRLEGRTLLEEAATTKNDTKPKSIPAAPRKGAPLLRLRKKIRDIYDDDDEDEEDEVTAPFFNITLMDEDEEERDKEREETEKLLRLSKQQQMVKKLNVIMDTTTTAKKLGLDGTFSKEDAKMVHSANYTPEEVHRKTFKKKITEPLGIKGDVPESEREKAALAMKRAQQELPSDSLKNMPAKEVAQLADAPSEEEMAELILKKSGRKKPKKSLVEIAKEINRYEQYEQEQFNIKKGKENEQ